MAASADCREEVTRNGGIKVLLQFLDASSPVSSGGKGSQGGPNKSQGSPNKSQGGPTKTSRKGDRNQNDERRPEDFAQMAATERVLQKSAIALSR